MEGRATTTQHGLRIIFSSSISLNLKNINSSLKRNFKIKTEFTVVILLIYSYCSTEVPYHYQPFKHQPHKMVTFLEFNSEKEIFDSNQITNFQSLYQAAQYICKFQKFYCQQSKYMYNHIRPYYILIFICIFLSSSRDK